MEHVFTILTNGSYTNNFTYNVFVNELFIDGYDGLVVVLHLCSFVAKVLNLFENVISKSICFDVNSLRLLGKWLLR